VRPRFKIQMLAINVLHPIARGRNHWTTGCPEQADLVGFDEKLLLTLLKLMWWNKSTYITDMIATVCIT